MVLPTNEFLSSTRYFNLMNQYIPYNNEYGKFEGSSYTRSYINRHHTHFHELGVFRWRGVQEHLAIILSLINKPSKIIIDFGGGGCPLGFNSILVDRLKKDITGNKIKYHNIKDIPMKADVVFACHVFEHLIYLDQILFEIKNILKPNGYLICMVPSFSNKNWNAGIHKNEKFGGHVWTCGLSSSDRSIVEKYPFYIDIDNKISNFFLIEKAEYCGDDSIFILAKKSK